tara:strand:- start:2495 stop:3274 length:780 start_codon:yes stop_codon:yes gene_type:complete
MNVKFTVNRKEFDSALNAVTLKGKYKNAHTSKLAAISNDVAGVISNDGTTLTLANASDTMAAMCNVGITDIVTKSEQSMFIFEVERILKYLKTFKDDDMYITITASNVILKTSSQRAQIPLLVEHSGMAAISRIFGMRVDVEGDEFPTFGRTTFETKVTVQGDALANAIKNCGIVGTATYRINFEDGELTASSVNFHQTEKYKVNIPIILGEGENSTLEVSAPLDKFCSGTMYLYMKDDAPILLCGVDRKLIVAPYIRG